MAQHRQAQRTQEPDNHPAAIEITRVEPGGKYLAISALKLSLKPRVQELQRHRRCNL